MQTQNTPSARLRSRSRHTFNASSGLLITAASVSIAVLLLVATLMGDFLRSPGLSASTSRLLLSPNGDGAFDIFDINYDLKNNASISVTVFSETGLVRTLMEAQEQNTGTHFLTWDGRGDNGSVVPDGAYRVEIAASAAFYSEKQSLAAQVDTLAPAVQLLNFEDNTKFNRADISVEGVTEPGAVLWWNNAVQPAAVNSSGRFTLPMRLQEGVNLFTLRVADAAGNVTQINRQIALVTQGPEIAIISPLENETTNQQVMEVVGHTQPGAAVSVNQQKIPVGADGFFRYQVALSEGSTLLHIEAADELGNITSLDRTVFRKAGIAPISVNVEEGASLAESTLQLMGRVEPGSSVSINGQPVSVGLTGDFQAALPLLEGQNVLDITAIDQAGNTTRLVRHVAYSPNAAQPLDAARVTENLNQTPWLLWPALTFSLLLLGFLYWRQNRVSLSLAVLPPVLSLGIPGEENQVQIYLDLSKTANVTLEVLDERGFPRATLLSNRRKLGRKHTFSWNGLDDNARPLPPGEYTVHAEAGAPPLQVSSAAQVRIERAAAASVSRPVSTQRNVTEFNRAR